MPKKVFVSGCYDMLHSGHIEFFNQASQYGDLYVALGSDRTIFDLKNRKTVNDENERFFNVNALKSVHTVFISKGAGHLDFVEELKQIQPDFFVVNHDGHSPQKQRLCEQNNIEYIILERTPHADLTPRSTTIFRNQHKLPYRIDLAGGWLDQPFVSKHHSGSVITISLMPTHEFNERSGMASSTRRSAQTLWGNQIPVGNLETLAKSLFCFDNPPGTKIISGSQDAIGLTFPGLAKANYAGDYWPATIQHRQDEQLLSFVESVLYLVPLGPRVAGYNVLENTQINSKNAKALADAAENHWQAILDQNIQSFGQSMRENFEAQVALFPNMLTPQTSQLIDQYRHQALGWKLSGAGGGGYLILVADEPIENAIQVTARRK